MFWKYYVLKLLRLETIMFSDATLSDINETIWLSYLGAAKRSVQKAEVMWMSDLLTSNMGDNGWGHVDEGFTALQ